MQITFPFEKFFEKTKQNLSSGLPLHPAFSSDAPWARKLLHALYQPYKWLVFVPFLLLSTLVFFLLALGTVILFGPKTCSAIFPPLWSRLNSAVIPMRVKVSGAEHIDPAQSYVVASNHGSLLDIFVLYGWLDMDIKWVMKTELRKVPIIGYICEKMDHIYIDRSDSRAAVASINQAKHKITNGTSVIFFPEGTRSADGKLGKFKKGAFRLAVDLNLPILPVTISGTRDILPKGSLDLFPGTVQMTIHPPIRVWAGERHIEPLMEKTRAVILAGLAEADN